MIHISISTGKKGTNQLHPPLLSFSSNNGDVYYQIFQDGKPLSGLHFPTKKEARKALRALPEALVAQSYGWYRVEVRRGGSTGIILGIRKHFDDGSAVESTFVVRKVASAVKIQYVKR